MVNLCILCRELIYLFLTLTIRGSFLSLYIVFKFIDSMKNYSEDTEKVFIHISSSPSVQEHQCFVELFTIIEGVGDIWMKRRDSHAFHGHIRTLKNLSVGYHYAWIIDLSVGDLTKQEDELKKVLYSVS